MAAPVVCTSVPRRRLAEASLLAESVATHHLGDRLVVLVADDLDRSSTEPGEAAALAAAAPVALLAPSEIGLDRRVHHELALVRDGDDLAACLVPALLAHLVRGGRPVVALDVRVALLAPLDALGERALASGLVLVPRTLRALPEDGRAPRTADLLRLGAFTPSIVAAGPSAGEALSWWAGALRSEAADSSAEPSRAQRSLGLVAQHVGAAVERDPGVGVGAWNAHERDLSFTPERGLRASGEVVRVVDLVGFDPVRPHLLSGDLRDPRVLLSESPGLARLCEARAGALARVRAPRSDGEKPGPVVLADGTALDDRMRLVARRAVALDGHGAVPDPFDPDGVEAFYDWLASPDPSIADSPSIPRYLAAMREERRDLLWHFPRVETVDRAHFRAWVEHHGLDEGSVPAGLREALARTLFWRAPTGVVVAPPEQLRPGVVLAGYLRAESGVGEAARLAYDSMVAAGVDVVAAVIGSTPSRQGHRIAAGADAPLADREVNLVWVAADQLPGFASVVGPEFFAGRYTVGYWAWEAEELPARMASSEAFVDEVWVPSRYVRDAVAASIDRPVTVVPHPVTAPPVDSGFDLSSLGVPGGFRFLYTYDFLSSFVRKNPLGVLEAFDSAFAPGAGPVLVLKSVNGDRHLEELERLRLAARRRADVVVLDGYLSAGARGALLASCDCYVSLHRSEGFGLSMGEAMALGRPVVATAYSGNLDFMDESCARLVPSRRVEVGEGAPPYDPGSHWAEPDLEAAAAHLRAVVADPDAARALGERGRERVRSRHGIAHAGAVAARRLDEISAAIRAGHRSSVADAVRGLR